MRGRELSRDAYRLSGRLGSCLTAEILLPPKYQIICIMLPLTNRLNCPYACGSMLQQMRLRLAQASLWAVYCLTALGPALWVLNHPMPVPWLRPLCNDTFRYLVACAIAAGLRVLAQRGGRWWSLLVIALTQAIFQAWCYNTGSHPALNPNLLWGLLPQTDFHLYYTQACELLNRQQISGFIGARHPYPIFLATLLWVCGHDFRLVTSLCTLLMALATWSVFEVVRLRLGGLAAAGHLACVTFYIRIYCTGLFMTEQLGLLFSLCAVGMLVESLCRDGYKKTWFWCGGLFFLTQALNARPAAYMTLPFLAGTAYALFPGDFKVRSRAVGLGVTVIAASLLLHGLSYQRVVAPPENASNAWYCIYGLLNGGNWLDGVKHSNELIGNKNAFGFSDYERVRQDRAQASYKLRDECLSEMRHNPSKLLRGCWRALQFLWKENTPFRCAYPKMPSPWFTESGKWCSVLGLLFAIYFLFKDRAIFPTHPTYRRLNWLLLAATVGIILSLPFAPPWDGETRILGATLPLFYLLPAAGVGGFYLFVASKLRQGTPGADTDCIQKVSLGPVMPLAVGLAGTLSLMISLGPWWLVDVSMTSKNTVHPVLGTMERVVNGDSVGSIDLSALRSGYKLHLCDDSSPTWLPRISRNDFIGNLPHGSYLPLAAQFKQLPSGTEIMTLPYWVLLVIDKEDARAARFTLRPDQAGRSVWPPVYFSKGLQLSNR